MPQPEVFSGLEAVLVFVIFGLALVLMYLCDRRPQ